MLAGWAAFTSFIQTHLDQNGLTGIKLAAMERKLRDEKRSAHHLALQLNEYKDAVALSGVKVNETTPWDSPQRMIASSFSDFHSKQTPLAPTGRKQLTNAIAAFKAERYERAVDLLDSFIHQYPEHPRAPEASYYLAESYFYLHKLENAVRTIDLIITHYPETPFAAFALLRLGNIMESRERIEEAADIYLSIVNNYPGSVAATMAEKNMRGLNL